MGISIIEDEIDKKRRELVEKGIHQQRAPFSPTEVKKAKKGRIYRGAYNDPRRVAELKSQGYEICKEEEFTVDDKKADGTHVYKDLVLMSCAQDSFVDRHAGYRAESSDRSSMVRSSAREAINRIIVDEGGGNAHRDHTFDDSKQGNTRNKIFEDDE